MAHKLSDDELLQQQLWQAYPDLLPTDDKTQRADITFGVEEANPQEHHRSSHHGHQAHGNHHTPGHAWSIRDQLFHGQY